MSVKLQKENIKISEVACMKYCQTTVECDFIVPDVKPDILKILQIESHGVVTQKTIQNGKVYIRGVVRSNILYVPDNNISGSVKSITTSKDFDYAVEDFDADDQMEICVEAECEPTEYHLLNSRKISLRSKVSFCIRLARKKEIEVTTGVDEENRVELLYRPMKIYNPCIDHVRDIIVRERLDVPAGKPSMAEVIKCCVKANAIESKFTQGKAVGKGELHITTLYCTDEESSMPEIMEHTVPFGEVLEIEGIQENMIGEIEYKVKDCYFEICRDDDGDKRILSCEITLEALIHAFETVECTTIEDAYGLKENIKIKKEKYQLEQFIAKETEKLSLKEQVCVPEYLPPVFKMCECTGVPSVENVEIGNDAITVGGYITCNFLYLSQDEATPISGFAHVLSFKHTFDIKGITPNAVCEAKVDTDHIICTISGDKNLEVRAILSLGVKATKSIDTEVVAEIEGCNEDSRKRPAAMTVYFVQKGDTLWKIAKKYQVSQESIVESNGAEKEIIKPGKCIYIFR